MGSVARKRDSLGQVYPFSVLPILCLWGSWWTNHITIKVWYLEAFSRYWTPKMLWGIKRTRHGKCILRGMSNLTLLPLRAFSLKWFSEPGYSVYEDRKPATRQLDEQEWMGPFGRWCLNAESISEVPLSVTLNFHQLWQLTLCDKMGDELSGFEGEHNIIHIESLEIDQMVHLPILLVPRRWRLDYDGRHKAWRRSREESVFMMEIANLRVLTNRLQHHGPSDLSFLYCAATQAFLENQSTHQTP